MKRISRAVNVGAEGLSASRKKLNEKHQTHWHEFYEIEYVASGEGDYVIDGTCYPIRRGMLFFMTPRNFHSVNARNCTVYNVMFSEHLCDPLFLSRLTECGNAFDTEEDFAFFDALFSELARGGNEKAFTACLINGILGKIAARSEQSSRSDPVVRGMFYLISRFRENPSLTTTAEYTGYTPTYFSALFRQETGETFKQCLDRLRFDYAKNLVQHSSLTAAEICRESGFDNYPNFLRRFRIRFGMSPGQMRKINL